MKNKKIMLGLLSTAIVTPIVMLSTSVLVEAQSADTYNWEKYESTEYKTAQENSYYNELLYVLRAEGIENYENLFDKLNTLDLLKGHNFNKENTVLYKGSSSEVYSATGNGKDRPYVLKDNLTASNFNSKIESELDMISGYYFPMHYYYNTETNEFISVYIGETNMGYSVNIVLNPNTYNISYKKGNLIETITGKSSTYQNNMRNDDGFWYVLGDKIKEPIEVDNTNSNLKVDLKLEEGEFTLKTSNVNDFGKVKLTAKKQTVTTDFEGDFGVIDARGTQEGWNVTVSATQFTIEIFDGFVGVPHQLPMGSLALNNVTGIERLNHVNQTDGLPSSLMQSATIIDTNNALSILHANQGEGLGEFKFNFVDALALTVDALTAKIDKVNYPDQPTPYTSTITWNLVTGP